MNGSSEQHPSWLQNFITTYENLSTDNLNLLSNVYHQEINFIDPIHQISGLNQLTDYFDGMYENIVSCKFSIHEVVNQEDSASIYWTMTYQHQKLKKSQPIIVEGSSLIKGSGDKVVYHRDYLDLGAMIYEQLPVLGKVIKLIKTKAAM
jgi:limonene-1,2-epoxide hydrolase